MLKTNKIIYNYTRENWGLPHKAGETVKIFATISENMCKLCFKCVIIGFSPISYGLRPYSMSLSYCITLKDNSGLLHLGNVFIGLAIIAIANNNTVLTKIRAKTWEQPFAGIWSLT